MVSPLFCTNTPENTMKNTIDDAADNINWIIFIILNLLVMHLCHSHSIINKPFSDFIFNDLFFC